MSEEIKKEQGNEQEGVNSGLQLSKEELDGLRFLSEEAKQKKLAAEAQKRRQERLASLKSQVGDDVYKQLEENGLKELAEQKPELLDTPAGLSQAIENIKLRMELKKDRPHQEQQNQEEQEPGTAGGASSGEVERKVPKAGTKEFYEALSSGSITPEDINGMTDLRPEDKTLLINNLPKPQSKGTAIFFGKT